MRCIISHTELNYKERKKGIGRERGTRWRRTYTKLASRWFGCEEDTLVACGEDKICLIQGERQKIQGKRESKDWGMRRKKREKKEKKRWGCYQGNQDWDLVKCNTPGILGLVSLNVFKFKRVINWNY